MNLSDLAILSIKRPNYCGIISRIGKKKTIDLMQNADLTEKAEHYKT